MRRLLRMQPPSRCTEFETPTRPGGRAVRGVPRRAGLAGVLGILLLARAVSAAEPASAPPGARRIDGAFLRGMTVSSQSWGQEWGWPHMRETLDELAGLGVNAIALHPYAWVGEDGSVRDDHAADPGYLLQAMAWAKERGIRVMLIPHLGYWGTRFSWRGEIDFPDAAGWDRFYAGYRDWIVRMASIAARGEAAVFCVGLEYDIAQRHEARWRALIAAVRGVYDGPLTYGAQHDKVAEVKFWDALDYLGVQAYFPLVRSGPPDAERLREAWTVRIAELRAVSARVKRPVLFTEIGYNASARAAAAPWEYTGAGAPAEAERVRRLCLRAALDLEHRFPELGGLFFWKWFPRVPGEPRENFDMRDPGPRALLEEAWGGAVRGGGTAGAGGPNGGG